MCAPKAMCDAQSTNGMGGEGHIEKIRLNPNILREKRKKKRKFGARSSVPSDASGFGPLGVMLAPTDQGRHSTAAH